MTPQTPPRLLLAGCGKMGLAMLRGWIHAVPATILAVDPVPVPEDLRRLPQLKGVASLAEVPGDFRPDAVILAVKPQQMAGVLPACAPFRDAVFLSIAAGRTLAGMAAQLGIPGVAFVRAMPNLPASIGQGMTVAVPGTGVTPEQKALCGTLLAALGPVAWIDDESQMDAVTALSGSGPAYVFALAEAMEQAGIALGLAPGLAAQLARQTVVGAGALLARSPETPEALRKAVTSPGGTTAAALEVLQATPGLNGLLREAMQAAAARSKALAN